MRTIKPPALDVLDPSPACTSHCHPVPYLEHASISPLPAQCMPAHVGNTTLVHNPLTLVLAI